MRRRGDGGLTVYDEFAGCGGMMQGIAAVPYTQPMLAANHEPICVASHTANFPEVEHVCEDVREIDFSKFPSADLFHASPTCPPFSNARGERLNFDLDTQSVLWETAEDAEFEENTRRGRLLMHEVVRYLRAMDTRGAPVLAGTVENVIQARKWGEWHAWRNAIEGLGYRTWVFALNSMHIQPVRLPRAPQSRNRLLVAYLHNSVGRVPDWDKWLRPGAWCPECDEEISAIQVFKRRGVDMGSYGPRGQYVYRCPHRKCQNALVEPAVLPAMSIIDWRNLGTRIGERTKPLEVATRARIAAGLRKYARPITFERSGNTFERRPGVRAWPVDDVLPTRTGGATNGLACPPLFVPAGGTWRTEAVSAERAMPARTCRETDGLVVAPGLVAVYAGGQWRLVRVEDLAAHAAATDALSAFIMRNNGSRGDGGEHCTAIGDPVRTLTTKEHQSVVTVPLTHLTVPYYGTGVAHSVEEPIGTVTTKDRHGLASGDPELDIDDVWFRMLTPDEIAAGMAFTPGYQVLGTRTQRVSQLGRAVTPCVGEVLYNALVEAITGEDLPRALPGGDVMAVAA